MEIKKATCLGKCQINTGVPYSSGTLGPVSRCRWWRTSLGRGPPSTQRHDCLNPGRVCFREALNEPFVLQMEQILPYVDCRLDPQWDLRNGVSSPRSEDMSRGGFYSIRSDWKYFLEQTNRLLRWQGSFACKFSHLFLFEVLLTSQSSCMWCRASCHSPPPVFSLFKETNCLNASYIQLVIYLKVHLQ